MNYAFIFPGQGSQNIGMGKDLYDNFQIIRDAFDKASTFCDIDFREIIFKENELINISEYTQPSILLNSMAHFKIFQLLLDENNINVCNSEERIKNLLPSLGHSLGEFTALCASGAFSLENAVKTVNQRGKFMQECVDLNNPASMMAILGLDDLSVENICSELRDGGKVVYPANYNCDGQIVVAGLKADLECSMSLFKEAGAKRAIMLNMSVASHCPLMDKATNRLQEILKLNSTFLPVISNATGNIYSTEEEAKIVLKEQLVKPVLYKQNILSIESKVDGFIEFGSSVLKGLNKKITSKPTISLTNLQEIENFVKEIKENI